MNRRAWRPLPLGNGWIATKFHVPAKRPTLVARQHLTERLSLGREARLTLVSAPAGFGKTTLLADWLALDQRDNDPTVFWAYVIAGLQRAVPGIGEAIVGGLVADLDAVESDVILVFDDYHLIAATLRRLTPRRPLEASDARRAPPQWRGPLCPRGAW